MTTAISHHFHSFIFFRVEHIILFFIKLITKKITYLECINLNFLDANIILVLHALVCLLLVQNENSVIKVTCHTIFIFILTQ